MAPGGPGGNELTVWGCLLFPPGSALFGQAVYSFEFESALRTFLFFWTKCIKCIDIMLLLCYNFVNH